MSEIIKTVKFCGGEWKARDPLKTGKWSLYATSDEGWLKWPEAVRQGWLECGPTWPGTWGDFPIWFTAKALGLAQTEVLA